MKYTKELIEKAKNMHKQGYDCTAIAKYLGFSSYWMVKYHVIPGRKKSQRDRSEKWRKDNREKSCEPC